MPSPTSDVRVYFVYTRRRCVVFAFLSGFHFPRIPLTHPQPALYLHPQQPSPMHPPSPFALADSPPPIASTAVSNPTKQALHPLHTSLIQLHSVACGFLYGELNPALRAPQATTKRDFGSAGSLRSQNDRVNARLLRLVVSYRLYLPSLARFASRMVKIGGDHRRVATCANTAE